MVEFPRREMGRLFASTRRNEDLGMRVGREDRGEQWIFGFNVID